MSQLDSSDLSLNMMGDFWEMGDLPASWMKKRPLPDSFILQVPVPCSPANNDYFKSVRFLIHFTYNCVIKVASLPQFTFGPISWSLGFCWIGMETARHRSDLFWLSICWLFVDFSWLCVDFSGFCVKGTLKLAVIAFSQLLPCLTAAVHRHHFRWRSKS